MGYRMKYTGEEVENRLEKVEANEESIAEIEGKITEAEGKIGENEGKITENADKIAEVDEATKTNAEDIASLGGKVAEVESKADANATAIEEVDGKADANESKIAEVGGKADANAAKIAEVEGKADANTESIAEIGGKVTEIEGGITEINGDIEALLESVAAVDAKADSNNQRINTIEGSKLPYVAEFNMQQILNAALMGTPLRFRASEFYRAVTSGRVFVVKTDGGGTCVAHTYIKDNVATAILYDAKQCKWYTLTALSSDTYIAVTASDSVNLMANEIYTTDFTMQQLIAALGESDGATLGVSTDGFVAALATRKSILIPDGTGGGYISLSGSFSNRAVFYVADSKMFLTITAADAGTLNLRRRSFDATAYVDVESAYKLSGNDGQGGGATSEAMGMYKIQYRTTVCPNFGIGGFPPLRVGQVLNLRFIFTAGLGDVAFANNSNWKAVKDRASSTSNDLVPAIVDVTVINPAEGAQMLVFYTVKKYS